MRYFSFQRGLRVADFRQSMEDAIRRGFCTMLRTSNALQNYFIDNGFEPARIPLGVGNFLYRLVCSREPVEQDAPSQSGGQCAGVAYGYTFSWRYQTAPGEPIQTANGTSRDCSFPFYGVVGTPAVLSESGSRYYGVTARDNVGVPFTVQLSASVNNPDYIFVDYEFNLYRCDGLPDNCGGVIQPPPAGYNNYDTDITYNIDDSTQVSIPVSINYKAPQITISNDVTVPVTINIDDPVIQTNVDVTANFNLSTGDITFNLGGGAGFDDRGDKTPDKTKPDGDVPDPPDDTGNNDPPEDDDPSKVNIIRGVLVNISQVDSGSSVIFQQDGQPDIYTPNLGYVHFKVRVSNLGTAWLADIPIKNKRQFVPCPWELGAIDAKWTFRGATQGEVVFVRYRQDKPRLEPLP